MLRIQKMKRLIKLSFQSQETFLSHLGGGDANVIVFMGNFELLYRLMGRFKIDLKVIKKIQVLIVMMSWDCVETKLLRV